MLPRDPTLLINILTPETTTMQPPKRLTPGQRRFLWSLTDDFLAGVLIDSARSGPSCVRLGLAEHGITETGHAQYRWPQP